MKVIMYLHILIFSTTLKPWPKTKLKGKKKSQPDIQQAYLSSYQQIPHSYHKPHPLRLVLPGL